MTTATLTPQSNQTPVVANVEDELSGTVWVARFPGSTSTSTLTPTFQAAVDPFIAAMRAAGMTVSIGATYRPPERSYLMHWSWLIAHGTNAETVPAKEGVHINWVHPTAAASVAAARQMVTAYGMDHLQIAPALHSLHNDKEAIDMTISWADDVEIKDAQGNVVKIDTTPRTGMNVKLKAVGATYGVKKFVGGATDKPHWSTTGH